MLSYLKKLQMRQWCCYKENKHQTTVEVLHFRHFKRFIKFNVNQNGYRNKVKESSVEVIVKFKL